jgi:hypothetical protein
MGRFFMHLFKITEKPCKSRTLWAFSMAKFGGESSHHAEIASVRGGVAMITVRPGSHVYHLLSLLSVVGEFPASSLRLLGSEPVLKRLVHKLESVQEIRFSNDGEVYRLKLLVVSGKRNLRTVRLSKSALPILSLIHENAAGYYLEAFGRNHFSSNPTHIWRNHRVGEAAALSLASGIEYRSYALPELSMTTRSLAVPPHPALYLARDLKKLHTEELNKTSFTTIAGALFYPGGCYAVYNTRGSVMKWSATGEMKFNNYLADLVRMNAGMNDVNAALLLGSDADIAMRVVMESDTSRKKHGRMDRIYPHTHFVPLNSNGTRLLKILTLPNRDEKILNVLFEPELRPQGYASMEYDAYAGGKYIYSHLDSDFGRLIRFQNALADTDKSFEVICFPWQAEFLKDYLGDRVILKQISMYALEEALEISQLEVDSS